MAEWGWRNPIPQGNSLDSVAYGTGTFVAVTRAGTIMHSIDTVAWPIIDVGTGLTRVRFLNNRFVAVGNSGSIRTSTDAIEWTPQASDTRSALLDVAYGNGRFVAVGHCDTITSSRDGATWTAQTSGIAGKENEKFHGVAYGNGLFVIVGLNGTVLASSNGTVWTDKSRPEQDDLVAIAFGGGYFLASSSRGEILRSAGGDDWLPTTLSGTYAIDYVNGRFVAVGQKTVNDDEFGTIFVSTDGLAWPERFSGTSEPLFGTAFGNGTYLIGGYEGTILTSKDTLTWTRNNSQSEGSLSGIAYGNGTFIAVGSCNPDARGAVGRPMMFSSSDLATWTKVDSSAYGPLSDVSYTGSAGTIGSFVAVGGYGSVLTSDDGSTWVPHDVPASLRSVSAHDSTLVAVGMRGSVFRSTDKVNWLPIAGQTRADLNRVAHGLGRFIAVGDNGTILLSQDDGQSWSRQDSGTTEELRGVAFGDSRFVVVSVEGQILTSADGTTWTPGVSWLDPSLYSVHYSSLIPGFIALGGEGRIYTSLDGSTWRQRHSGTTNYLTACVSGNGSIFVAGQGCTILQLEVFAPLFVERPVPVLRSGSQVTWHCEASGPPDLRYAFTLTKHSRATPAPAPAANPTFQESPDVTYTLGSPGTYFVTAQVREPRGTIITRNSRRFVLT
jgi:photosystem II stability/assembly factor-like uncharacterized protein